MLMTYRRSGVELEVLAPGPLRRPRRGARSVGSQAGAAAATNGELVTSSRGKLANGGIPICLASTTVHPIWGTSKVMMCTPSGAHLETELCTASSARLEA